MTRGGEYREVGEAAWSWVLGHVHDDEGPWLPGAVAEGWHDSGPPEDRDSLYAGIAGLAPALAEIRASRGLTVTEQALADRIVERLAREAASRAEPSLYDGLAGDAAGLRLLERGTESVALQRLAGLGSPAGWATTIELADGPRVPLTDVVCGAAGIVMAAVWAGGEHGDAIATTGCEFLLDVADETPGGLDWGMRPHSASRGPNFSHGTAGIASALAIAGAALGRRDFVEAAVQGAGHLLEVGSLDDGGFIVPHTIPPSTREVEPLTYTWCHGPTGTSLLFAALAHARVDEVGGIGVSHLRDRCLHSVLTSGVPQRLRPGFWDNDGRCCGTAGVGDALLDAAQDAPDADRADELLAASQVMADALVERAILDDAGARWRFIEYRIAEPLLPPNTSWMQGAAGIGAFLIRLGRVLDDGLDAPVVTRPDQWWAVPAALRAT